MMGQSASKVTKQETDLNKLIQEEMKKEFRKFKEDDDREDQVEDGSGSGVSYKEAANHYVQNTIP